MEAKKSAFDQVPIEKATTYACEDADITLMARHFAPKLERIGLTELMNRRNASGGRSRMEERGMCVDKSACRSFPRVSKSSKDGKRDIY